MAMSLAKKADLQRDKKLGIKQGSKKDKKKIRRLRVTDV
jgi:hypothetical protein